MTKSNFSFANLHEDKVRRKTVKEISFEINKNIYELCIITVIVGTSNVLKKFCHSTAFSFASKRNDTDHKQKNKQILSMWGKGESTMTIIHCNYIHTYIKMSPLNFSILRNERICPSTSALSI